MQENHRTKLQESCDNAAVALLGVGRLLVPVGPADLFLVCHCLLQNLETKKTSVFSGHFLCLFLLPPVENSKARLNGRINGGSRCFFWVAAALHENLAGRISGDEE